MTLKTRPGSPSPLGATWDGSGTNFAIYSEFATGIDLCLVEHRPGMDRERDEIRIPLRAKTDHVWHVYVEGIAPGQHYGYRVDGPWDPQQGHRFNKHSRLLDPWARAVAGVEDWDAGAFSYELARDDLAFNDQDQRASPLAVVVDSTFDWEGDAPPNIPLADTVIYEAHVKGLTQQHPHVAAEMRGTYAGLATEPVIRYLKDLGVTALELLPIHHFVDDKFLLDKGLRNYWGYNTIAFFAPDPRYRVHGKGEPGGEVRELKQAIKTLHRAGIEVILDVVYNHTAEGNHQGPTFSLKGIDNRTYYRLVGDSPRHYFDYTGTGNTLDTRHPQSLRLVMDSLRYWIEEMHVDGFRFDLASTLARTQHEVDRLSSFFTIIKQDPVISRVKLIAEPWDVGDGGYQVGGFPLGWSEWNGKYRDSLRAFWRGDEGKSAEASGRIAGSSDLYQSDGRSPSSSINLIVAHDGFTLRDLVSYNHKHNDTNGEGNRDGSDHDLSWNHGHEGETDDAGIRALRWRQLRNMLTTLLLSQGTPMLCGGDEFGRTQHGNNNAYCQDNEVSWFDWNLDDEQRALLEFTRKVIKLRAEHPVFRRAGFFRGQIAGLEIADAMWLRHDGQPMRDEDWHNAHTSSFVMFLAGAGTDRVDAHGEPVLDDDFLLAFNASGADLELALPVIHDRASELWELVLDTFDDDARGHHETGSTTQLRARSVQVYRRAAPSKRVTQGAPSSTYRLQLHAGFTFADTAALTDYLAQLGVGAIYTSPYSRAERGSMHGYNVIDHATLNPEIGDADSHGMLVARLRDHGLGHILDFVPNHVGVGAGENRWWIDVLENGPASLYADYFDIDWQPPTPGLANRVLLPVLGEQFGAELEGGKLSIAFEAEADRATFAVAYYDKRWPVAPRTWQRILDLALEVLALPKDDPTYHEVQSIRTALSHIPLPSETAPERREERAREKEVIKRRLGEVCTRSTEVRAAIEAALAAKNPSGPGDVGAIEWLDTILGDQNYRLAYWRVATEEVNYRRFFDINELAAIRMEDPRVFEATHALVLGLVESGAVTGLRLDHTDGLYEPQAYFKLLQERLRLARKVTHGDTYVLAEKILEHGEILPRSWPIAGTTGYDFLAVINGQWVDASATQRMTEIYTRLTGEPTAFAPSVFTAKRAVLDTTFSAEIITLGQALRRLAETDRRSRDFTLYALTTAIKDTLAAFPVYRTYLAPGGSREPNDEAHVEHAIALAKRKNRGIDPSVLDYLRDVLLLRIRSPAATHIAMRFQQLSGPVMAKGVEDTAFYRYHRLAALTDVGCDPSRFGTSTDELHAHNTAMLAAFPLTMTTTTTHDTKRSEDVRTRIAVLSELPDEWETRAARWLERARGCCDGEHCPTPNDLYLLFQTLLGAWPLTGEPDATFRDRIDTYMRKAMREAKVSTSWTRPDEGYEQGMTQTIHGLLDDLAFRADLADLAHHLTPYGACNSLAQVAVKLASPGVPDIYQGTELWDLSLVDPDNRRPVDYAHRRELLASLGEPSPQLATDLVTHFADGRIKLHVTRVGLQLRRQDPTLFLEGSYHALDAGPHAIAFLRSRGSTRLACIVPRLPRTLTRGERPFPLGDVWGDRTLELPGTWKNVFTNERFETTLALRDIFATFPVAWLLAE